MKLEQPPVEHDAEPTLVMPAPGGQATVRMKRPAPARVAAPDAALQVQRMVAGINPLVGAAGPLLGLVDQLRCTTLHADPAALRRHLLDAMAEFEAQLAANGIARPKITAARYLLCSFLDEVIAQTPWGSEGPWAARNLLQEFHDERWGGDKAFQLLERLGEEPEDNGDLLELFYICLCLGFEGRYRSAVNGRSLLDAIAARTRQVIQPAATAAAARCLSPHWQGVALANERQAAALPLWVVPALCAALMLGLFLTVNARLDALAQPVFRQVLTLPVALRLPRVDVAARPRLAPLLQADLARGALQVRDEALGSLVTLAADTLFVPGSARLDASQAPLLGRVALALKDSPGQIAVIGHTDGEPVSSPQFPSQWHLSQARARAVLVALAQAGIADDRLRAEGRADAEPLLPNDNDAARARNRRVEIELRLPRPNP